MTPAAAGLTPGAAAILHITFDAGAQVLRAALALAGRDERVLVLADDVAVGPIEDAARRDEAFWTEALAPAARRIVWTDRRVARQYAGLLAFVARAGDADFEIIDLTHAGVRPLGLLEPEAVLPLLDRAAPLSVEARQDLAEDWAALRAEDAPLRVIDAGRLISVPETFFDEAILDQCSPYWMRRVLVVEMAVSEQGWRGVWNAGAAFVDRRIDALIAEGRLEGGSGSGKTSQPEVRLPQLDDRQSH